MKKIAFYTLGCKVNQYETEALTEIFQDEGFLVVPFDERADVYVINTCTVTNLSDRKSRQIIRKAKKNNPQGIIAVTGCYAQVSKDEVLKMEDVDIVMGTKERKKLLEMVKEAIKSRFPQSFVEDIMKERDFEDLNISNFSDRTRAYVKIQDGCNQFCAYCIIPYARGPIRSKLPLNIKTEVEKLVQNGFKEIVLTGIHLTSYGKDCGRTLQDALEAIVAIEGLKRIRLGSLEPSIVTEEFAAYIQRYPQICPQFHLSLQSGCDETLSRMNRKYTTRMYRDSVNILRKFLPEAAITTDIIVGFPGETDKEFDKTMEFVKEIGYAKIHVFKFSPRKGTKAFDMEEQVPATMKEARSAAMIAAQDEMQKNFNQKFVGKTLEVLFECKEPGNGQFYHGYTANYIKVLAKGDEGIKNTLCKAFLVKVENDYVNGNILG